MDTASRSSRACAWPPRSARPGRSRGSRPKMIEGPASDSDDDVLAHVRQHVMTIYHPVGTCRMGDDDGAVVDGEQRVRGVESLRVVDASVMPDVPRGNTSGPDDRPGRAGDGPDPWPGGA